jgi:hypothetical protein
MLVNTPSSEVPSLLRVKPGDPDSSYIIQKLEGRAAVGAQMPLGQAPLPQSTIDIIRQWISEGATAAAQTATAASTKPRTFVRVVAPIEGETLTRFAGDPLFAADGQLDINSLNAASIAVVRSGGDGSFDDGNEVAVQGARFEIRAAQPTVFAVVLPRTERIPDTYRLTLRATGPAAVLDLGGNAAPADLILQYSIEDLP